jgi:hypothetical protein
MRATHKNIKNLAELQMEIQLSKANYTKKGESLRLDIKAYAKQYTLAGLVKKYTTPNAFFELDGKINFSSKILSVVLPMVLDKLFFKKSGYVTKILAALVSGKIAKSLDAETLVGLINYIKTLFKNKEEKLEFEDFGIPPDSETY